MKQECIDAVSNAAGRKITQAEAKDIEQRISRNMRSLARKNKGEWQAMPEDVRVMKAAESAAKEIKYEAELKKYREARRFLRQEALMREYNRLLSNGHTATDSVRRIITFDPDTKSGLMPLESRISAFEAFYMRELVSAFEATHPKFLGMLSNKQGIMDFLNELWGVKTRNEAAAKGAEAWRNVTENMRMAFNNAGGKIGKLEDWMLPQHHYDIAVRGSGKDIDRDAWVSYILPKLDRSKYLKEDGALLNDAELSEVLRGVWLTIATGGANKIEPGKAIGNGMRANAHSDFRSIHFKSADDWADYMQKYGSKDLYSILIEHVGGLARDIAITEFMGPNPHALFQYMRDTAIKHDTVVLRKDVGKVNARIAQLENEYNFASGKINPPANQKLANASSVLTNTMVASKLGSAFISSLPDNAFMHVTTKFYNMSSLKLMRNQLSQLDFTNPEHSRLAQSAGVGLNTFIGEVNRFGRDMVLSGVSQKLANGVMRASFLNAVTEARRKAFASLVFSHVGRMTREYNSLNDISADDARLFLDKGVDDKTWEIWRAAGVEDWGYGNDQILTANTIMKVDGFSDAQKQEAAIKLLALTNEETNMAVIQAGVRERVALGAGMQRGTWKGEFVRAMFLFKSFPITALSRHMRRSFKSDITPANKALYFSTFFAGTTLLGAASLQLSELINGRDPLDMTEKTFWGGALLKGGSLGVYGDFILQANTSYGNTPTAILMGPTVSTIESAIGLTQGNLVQLAQGKDTNFAPEAVRFIKNNTPFQNLWYTRAVTDRLIFGSIQDMLEPGYMRRIQRRMEKGYNKSFFAPLDASGRLRAPDFKRAVGQ